MGAKKQAVAALLSAAAVAATAAAPTMALASTSATMGAVTGSSADTKLYLVSDDSKITVQAPTEVHVAVQADGTLITPTNATITNTSIYAVHVDALKVASQGTFAMKEGAAGTNTENLVTMTVATDKGSSSAHALASYVNESAVAFDSSDADWDMTKADAASTNDTLALTFAGSIKNITANLGTEAQFATLTWVFAAGANS
jgi:hypothetical protein